MKRKPVPEGIPMSALEVGIGPLSLDVEHAIRLGWSRADFDHAVATIESISQAATGRSHRRGPVPTCGCAACDPLLDDGRLLEPSLTLRRSWRQRGTWPPKRTPRKERR